MKTILDIIQAKKEKLYATCNGHKTCGKCKIKVLENLSITQEESRFLTQKEIDEGVRLACCHEYFPDIHYEILNQDMDILEDISVDDLSDLKEEGNGLIVDIGTTTVVMKWISLINGESLKTVSFRNPQAVYGGDVISRIDYSSSHPHVLNQVLIEQLERNIQENIDFNIKRMIVCGNTVMTHLFLDCDISSLGHVPFDIPIPSTVHINSSQIFKTLTKTFDILTFPHIAAFVGGDITSGILALNIDQSIDDKMLVDLGTNGEIVVGNKEKILTTSTAAGPAFEGVGIACGGPSIPGAITEVKINDRHIEYKTIANQTAQSICGSGLISLIAELRRKDIIDDMGRFTSPIDKWNITENIYITRKDIQSFQLAKAAIQAGVTSLLQENGEVSEIYISGGFGAHVHIEDLIELKIFPEQYLEKIKNVKNSALSGAYVLLRTQDDKRLDQIIDKSQNINLASYPDFDDLLVEGLYF